MRLQKALPIAFLLQALACGDARRDTLLAPGEAQNVLNDADYFISSQQDLDELATLGGSSFRIERNLTVSRSSLLNLEGLNNLTSIGGILRIESNGVLVRISVKKATCFGFKVATHRSVATLVGLGWVSGFFESSFL